MDVSEFKQVYNKEGSHNLKVQIPYLEKLAKHYEQLGRENPRRGWTAVLKAHALYNSCAARCTEREEMKHFTEKAFEVQNYYLKFTSGKVSSVDHLHKLRESHVSHLGEIRLSAQKGITPVAEQISLFDLQPQMIGKSHNTELIEKCVQIIEPVVTRQSDSMINLSRSIIRDSVALMREHPPCEFEAVALGSMSRGESTPYSDLEFLFLLEHKDKSIAEYFETLALTVYFLIGNIQETKLKYMAIDELSGWFTDEAKNGFKIDGLQKKAGNIPTGNGSTNIKNKFICTVQELAKHYKSVFDDPQSQQDGVTGDDSDMLASTCLIYTSTDTTSGELLNEFSKLVFSMKPNLRRQAAMNQMMDSDLINYNYLPMYSQANMQIAAKPFIYRYPSLFILNNRIKYGLSSSSSIETIEQLFNGGIISKDCKVSLRNAFLLAVYIRLSCYLHHDSQQEDIRLRELWAIADGWYLHKELFIMYYSSIVELRHFLGYGTISHVVSRCEAAISVAFCHHDKSDAEKYGEILISIDQISKIHVELQISLVGFYQLRTQAGKALKICLDIFKNEYTISSMNQQQLFMLEVTTWSIMLETQNPLTDTYLERIKHSSELESNIIYLISVASNTTSRIINRDRRKVFIDTKFMEETLLNKDPSNNRQAAWIYSQLHEMNNNKKLAIDWAKKSLELHKKEDGIGEETVTVFGLLVLQFLACQYFAINLDESEKYAKRALVIDFQVEMKPPRYRGRMYNVLSYIFKERGNERMSSAFYKKALECWEEFGQIFDPNP